MAIEHRLKLQNLRAEFAQIAVSSAKQRYVQEFKSMSDSEKAALSSQLKATRNRLTRELNAVANKKLEDELVQVNIQLDILI